MPAACQPVPTFHGEPCPSIQLSHKPAAAEGGRTPDRHPPKADEPRTDTHPRRTKPGPTTIAVRSRESGHPAPPPQPTPHNGGRTPDRHPPKADEPRTDHHGGQEPGIRPPCPTAPANPHNGGRTPDRHPPKGDETRTDTHPRRTKPGPTTMAVRSRESGHPAPPPQPTPHNGGRTPDRHPPKADETRIDHHAVGGGGVGTGGGGG